MPSLPFPTKWLLYGVVAIGVVWFLKKRAAKAGSAGPAEAALMKQDTPEVLSASKAAPSTLVQRYGG